MSGAPDLVTWVGTKLLLEPLLELIAGAGEGLEGADGGMYGEGV